VTIKFEKLKARLLANPKVKAEHGALAPEFEIAAASRFPQITSITIAIPSHKGAFRHRHGPAAGYIGRGQCQKTNDAVSTLAKGSADRYQTVEWLFERCSAKGEGVWS
jgi:hypothetical protein